MTTEVVSRAQAWIDDDPDPRTRDELRAVIQAVATGDLAAATDLADRFSGPLVFGTAGLRGALGAGQNRMNRAVVIRAAAGLAAFLSDTLSQLGEPSGATVVIGFDARYGSHRFAEDTAAVMTAAGHRAMLLPDTLPTPVLAYAVRALDADAGVMVTASHNPREDNGYKVYLGGRIVTDAGQGAQIVPPYDAAIAERIAAVQSVAAVPRAPRGWDIVDGRVIDDYTRHAAGVVGPAPEDGSRSATRIVLTALHGVGAQTVEAVLHAAGFTDLHHVPEQAEPDPDFPTVAFPNPEEPGAIDLALALAEQVDAHVVIANDPDADRCAVATRLDGAWTMLHGDVLGSLLGERIGARQARLRMAPGSQVMASSVVSSRHLAAIAARHGLGHATTLTGFKWIARTQGLVYGYEEALGYCVEPSLVRDKDGITAAVVVADLVTSLAADGRTVADAIDDLARLDGVYLTRQVSVRFADLSDISVLMDRLLDAPPAQLGGSAVLRADDMSTGTDGLPPTTGLFLGTADDARVIIRPSGTEPKVKAYLEVVRPAGDDVRHLRAEASAAMDELEADVRAVLGLSPAP